MKLLDGLAAMQPFSPTHASPSHEAEEDLARDVAVDKTWLRSQQLSPIMNLSRTMNVQD